MIKYEIHNVRASQDHIGDHEKNLHTQLAGLNRQLVDANNTNFKL